MFTASDVRKRLKEINLCEGIDEWIESVLVPRFSVKSIVPISNRAIKWSKDSFIASMRQRGFLIEYHGKGGGCWYEISLPTEEE